MAVCAAERRSLFGPLKAALSVPISFSRASDLGPRSLFSGEILACSGVAMGLPGRGGALNDSKALAAVWSAFAGSALSFGEVGSTREILGSQPMLMGLGITFCLVVVDPQTLKLR